MAQEQGVQGARTRPRSCSGYHCWRQFISATAISRTSPAQRATVSCTCVVAVANSQRSLLLLQLFAVLARLAQLPQAGVWVCAEFQAEDIVFVHHPMGLGTQALCRALHKLQLAPSALPGSAAYPTGALMKGEAAGDFKPS